MLAGIDCTVLPRVVRQDLCMHTTGWDLPDFDLKNNRQRNPVFVLGTKNFLL